MKRTLLRWLLRGQANPLWYDVLQMQCEYARTEGVDQWAREVIETIPERELLNDLESFVDQLWKNRGNENRAMQRAKAAAALRRLRSILEQDSSHLAPVQAYEVTAHE